MLLFSDHFALKESKYDERTLFWGSLQKLFLSVNSQLPKDAYTIFFGIFQFQAIFDILLLLLDIKSKFIKFCTKFQVKQAKFLLLKCTNLLLCSNPELRIYLHSHPVRCLRVKCSTFFRRAVVGISTCKGDFRNSYFQLI